jgi:DNA-binding beta-propeller fold protein YncE
LQIVRTLIFYCLLILVSCAKKEKNSLFESQQSVGSAGKKLHEASGLIASISNPGYLWTLNDGKNPSEIYLIDEQAEVVMTCKLKNIVNRDWEDITIGSGPEEGVNYLYVADIGDNDARYPFKILYRLKEPVLADKKIEVEQIDTLVFELPGGPRDSETILADPITNGIYIISKREHSVKLYEINFTIDNDTLQAQEVGELPFNNIVSADISQDGSEVLLKNYRDIYYWRRIENESLSNLLQRKPIKLDYKPEPQGEAIAWKLDGSGFYTLSESVGGAESNLYFYKRK